MKKKEIWKDIIILDGRVSKDYYVGLYKISNYCRIKSLPRKRTTAKGIEYMSKEKILKPRITKF